MFCYRLEILSQFKHPEQIEVDNIVISVAFFFPLTMVSTKAVFDGRQSFLFNTYIHLKFGRQGERLQLYNTKVGILVLNRLRQFRRTK